MMWKLCEISPESEYVIQLCHSAYGQRYFRLRTTTDQAPGSDVVFETKVVPHELLKARNLSRIAQEVKLANDEAFEVDPHGIWFTPQELDALEEAEDVDSVQWCTTTPPVLAPY